MKIVNSAVDTIERIGVGTDQAFTIKFDAKMAKILADGLYSDKVQSVIRELSCNAWDSHVEAGRSDTPFEVHFPTSLEPWFSVTDFGVGLTHDQVISIYTCYGASTKTNSNEVIGQLGLGSKSPFSLCNAFDVSSRKDGIENHYSMYKDELGMPSVAHLGSNPTSKGNGVTVKIPVTSDQRREFAEKAANVYMWFPVKPVIKGISSLSIKNIEYAYESKNWGIRSVKADEYWHSRPKPVALMGLVAYPLDPYALNISDAQRTLMSLPVVLHFNIGDLEVAANREALGYDARTSANIVARIDEMMNEMGTRFEQEIAASATLWEARSNFDRIFGNGAAYSHEFRNVFQKQGLKWNNVVIKTSNEIVDLTTIYDKASMGGKVLVFSDRAKSGRQFMEQKLAINCVPKTKIIFNDLKFGGLSRSKEYYKTVDKVEDVYLFNQSQTASWDDIKNTIGNPEVIYTSTLPKPVRAKTVRSDVLQWKGGDTKIMKGWDRVDIDLDQGGYYVEMNGWSVLDDNKSEVSDLQYLVKNAREAGILTNQDIVYGIRSSTRNIVRDDDNWIELIGHIRAKTSEMAIAKNLAQMIADSEEYHRVTNEAAWYYWKHIHIVDDENSVFAKFRSDMLVLESNVKEVGVINNALRSLCNRMGIALANLVTTFDVHKQLKEVHKTYPMINFNCRGGTPSHSDIVRAVEYVNFINVCRPFYNLSMAETENSDGQ